MNIPRIASALPCLALGYLGAAVPARADAPPDEPGREAQPAQARTLATQQTRHEWCRLLSLTTAA